MRQSLGVLTFTDAMPAAELERFVGGLEGLGYEGFWAPEVAGRAPFSTAGLSRLDSVLSYGD